MIVKPTEEQMKKITDEYNKEFAKIEEKQRRMREDPEFIIFMHTPISI